MAAPTQIEDARWAMEDMEDRELGIEVVYVRAAKLRKGVRCTRWFRDKDPRNQARLLPGRIQTQNCGLVFALREALKCLRQEAFHMAAEERVPLLIVRTDATYLSDGVETYLYRWRRREWCSTRHKPIANVIFWKSVNYELTKLEDMGIQVRVEYRCRLPLKCVRL